MVYISVLNRLIRLIAEPLPKQKKRTFHNIQPFFRLINQKRLSKINAADCGKRRYCLNRKACRRIAAGPHIKFQAFRPLLHPGRNNRFTNRIFSKEQTLCMVCCFCVIHFLYQSTSSSGSFRSSFGGYGAVFSAILTHSKCSISK